MPASAKRTVTIALEEEYVDQLENARGSTSMASFVRGMVVRALEKGAPEQTPIEVDLRVRKPTQVSVDLSPVMDELGDLRDDLHEIMRAVHQYGVMLAHKVGKASEAQARDEGQRRYEAFLKSNLRNGEIRR